MNIAQRARRTFVTGDRRWVLRGAERASADNQSITLDISKFSSVTDYPDGFLPSGMILGEVTATPGVFGKYGGGTSEAQTLTRTSTGGTITLAWDGATTAAIAASAAGFTAAAVQTALDALPNIYPGDVVVTGSAGGPLTVTFGGQYTGKDVATLVVDNTSATGGTIVAAVGTAGGSAVSDGRETAVGLLWADIPVLNDAGVAATKCGAALLWHGSFDASHLPSQSGIDATARRQLATKFRIVN